MFEARFGFSHFGKTLLWAASEVYSLYALTDLFGVAPELAGALFLAMLVWSAGCDVAAGAVADRSLDDRARWRMMSAAAVLSAIGFVFASAPLPVPAAGAVGIVSAFAFRALFAFFDVPHNTLLAQLARTEKARARLSTIRLLTGAAAALAVAGLGLLVLTERTGLPEGRRFLLFAVILAVAGAVLSLTYPRIHQPPAASPTTAPSAWRLTADPGVAALFLSTMISIVAAGAFMKSLVYISKYAVEDVDWVGRALVFLTLGKLLSAPLWFAMAQSRGPRFSIALAYGLIAAAALGFAALFDWPLSQAMTLLLVGAGLGGASLLSWSLLAGLAEDLAARSGARIDARLFGLFTCASKIATGFSGAALGLVLGRVQLTSAQGSDQLVWAIALLIAVCGFAAAILLQLDRRRSLAAV